MARKPATGTRAPRQFACSGSSAERLVGIPKGVPSGGELLHFSLPEITQGRNMIATGFEIAFGIFLFIVVLGLLFYGVPAIIGAMMLLWSWASGKALWVKVLVVLAILSVLGWILKLLGLGE